MNSRALNASEIVLPPPPIANRPAFGGIAARLDGEYGLPLVEWGRDQLDVEKDDEERQAEKQADALHEQLPPGTAAIEDVVSRLIEAV